MLQVKILSLLSCARENATSLFRGLHASTGSWKFQDCRSENISERVHGVLATFATAARIDLHPKPCFRTFEGEASMSKRVGGLD